MADFTEEFHRLGTRNNLNETEEQQMARYIGDLKSNLQEKEILESPISLKKTISISEHLERQTTKYSSLSAGASSSRSGNMNEKIIPPTTTHKNTTWKESLGDKPRLEQCEMS